MIVVTLRVADFGCATSFVASFVRHPTNGDVVNPPFMKWRNVVAIFWAATRSSPSGGHGHPCGAPLALESAGASELVEAALQHRRGDGPPRQQAGVSVFGPQASVHHERRDASLCHARLETCRHLRLPVTTHGSADVGEPEGARLSPAPHVFGRLFDGVLLSLGQARVSADLQHAR